MKLRNKKTGEIVEICKICPEPFEARDFACNSLAELNEEWEDYEEPKDKFFKLTPALLDNRYVVLIVDEKTNREEGKRALEKLKAFMRLKEKGFRFERWLIGGEYGNTITFSYDSKCDDKTKADLDLLFGGEE